jgi:hypothetical protein
MTGNTHTHTHTQLPFFNIPMLTGTRTYKLSNTHASILRYLSITINALEEGKTILGSFTCNFLSHSQLEGHTQSITSI